MSGFKGKKQPSPIKIKEYFTNPLHRIKERSFIEVGFNQNHLNTFVKSFTNRNDPNYISIEAIRKFIYQFTNGNPKLMKNYEEFFFKNFKVQKKLIRSQGKQFYEHNIELEGFIQWFMKETKADIEEFQDHDFVALFRSIEPLNVESLMERSQELEIPMTENQAHKIIKMINFNGNTFGESSISEQSFVKAMTNK